jgi:Spy/CpxP family protein refolding chaperone
MTRLPFLVSLALASVSFAQGPHPPNFTELKAYLNLTDSQVQALQTLRQNSMASMSTVHAQMRTAEESLRAKMQTGNSSDATAAGNLMMQMSTLRKQVEQAQVSLTQQSIATLTPDQQTKLKALQAAADLQPDIMQAQMLGLLARPARGPGGGPGAFGGEGRALMHHAPPPPAN